MKYAVAIVGMAGRFPGARDVDQLWANLRAGVDSISRFSPEEMLAAGADPARIARPGYVPARGVLSDADRFDAAFFGVAPREAELMDPQIRVFLECAWEALECAGHDPESFEGPIGVYAGATASSYYLHNLLHHRAVMEAAGAQAAMLGDNAHLSAWTSYKLNLRGPSVNVQTACSTSLVAVHMAVHSLLAGECRMALAGGASVRVPLLDGYECREDGGLSPDGKCRAFDADARGTVEGSGAGVVVLRLLEDALADGDTIHAVIRGTAVNNDGAFRTGFAQPSVDGQAEVIAEAHAVAGVAPESIGYVEAHGAATPLADSVEIEALTRAFRAGTRRTGFCAVGSIKGNVGHLDAAAGIAGFIKTVLALRHAEIPATLHFQRPSPRIDFDASPFRVATAPRPWVAAGEPRRAGVSAFGMGGTNAHVVLEEAPPAESHAPARPWQLLVISARTAAALEAATDRLAERLRQGVDSLADVAFTLQAGRRALPYRRALVCRDAAEAAAALAARDARVLTAAGEVSERPARVVPGALDLRPVRELYRTDDVFHAQVDGCPALTGALALREMLCGEPVPEPVEHALAALWLAGARVDWRALHPSGRRRVPLPTYPFERQRFWLESPVSVPAQASDAAPGKDAPRVDRRRGAPLRVERVGSDEVSRRKGLSAGEVDALLVNLAGGMP